MSRPTRALSIRQPWAELILRGIKRIEYRSRPTTIVGERFWIYAAGKPAGGRPRVLTSDNIAPGDPPPWMTELADALRLFPEKLPTGLIVGSAVIERCTPASSARALAAYEWHLADVERLAKPIKPDRHPQPVWFLPFAEVTAFPR